MIPSRRISKLYNQLSLLEFRNVVISQKRERFHTLLNENNIIIRKNICETIISNPNKNYLLGSIIENRYVSTSSNLFAQTEIMKGEGDQGLNLDYEDIIKAQKDDAVLIVDVREDEEIKETGKLPGSIHIPMGQAADVLNNLPEKDFSERYEKPKPNKNTKIIFSCRSGKRSAKVQEEMIKLGYEKSYNYTGGWLDWESKQA